MVVEVTSATPMPGMQQAALGWLLKQPPNDRARLAHFAFKFAHYTLKKSMIYLRIFLTLCVPGHLL